MTSQLDLTGGRLNLVVVGGRDVSFDIPLPVDLSEWTWSGMVRATPASATLLGQMDIELSPERAVVTIPAIVTAGLPPRSRYEIVVGDPAGTETTLLSGRIDTLVGVVR